MSFRIFRRFIPFRISNTVRCEALFPCPGAAQRVAAREIRRFLRDIRVALGAGRVIEVLSLRREVRRLVAEALLCRANARRLIERRVESGINFVKCRGNRTL